MAIPVKVPSMGESITSGILTSWLVQDGDYVNKGDLLYELETDKITSEAPAEVAGIITIKVPQDEEVEIGQVVAEIDETATAPSGSGKLPSPVADPGAVPEPEEEYANVARRVAPLSPAVRKLIEEHNIDPTSLIGTGKDGRILKGDVLKAIDQIEHTPEGQADATSAYPETLPTPAPQETSQPKPPQPAIDESGRTTRKRLSPLRRKIAERLVAAQRQAALLTTFNEVDLSQVMALRKKHQESFVAKYGIKLGFMSFFVKAVTHALQTVPELNAQMDGESLIQNHYYDIGVAVGTEKGLVVPVVRECDKCTFAEIEQQILDYAKKAREGKISIDDLQGGVFTISNGGIYGSMLSTPIVNPPQSGILGMHSIQERPIAINGEVVIRPMMYLALTYDHRIVDGKEAVTFLKTVKELLEEPARMLFGI
jgi:2-oxoglutarate dehydrogenase E2 component (dihydrolipoamide succinyltransferase)